MDLILTGRGVSGDEALRMGLANRLVAKGTALAEAVRLAHELARFPQRCLRADRLSAYAQWALPWQAAWQHELQGGLAVMRSGETRAGAERFARGAGRHGSREES
jgi:enoyl-CoA hydratase